MQEKGRHGYYIGSRFSRWIIAILLLVGDRCSPLIPTDEELGPDLPIGIDNSQLNFLCGNFLVMGR